MKTSNIWVGGRHRSATTPIESDIKNVGHRMLFGKRVQIERAKSTTVSDNTMQAEKQGNFFENIGKAPSKGVVI